MTQGFCMKCRDKRDLTEVKAIVMKNGHPAIQGKCSVCGTRVFRIGT
jgi:hypothetical protein